MVNPSAIHTIIPSFATFQWFLGLLFGGCLHSFCDWQNLTQLQICHMGFLCDSQCSCIVLKRWVSLSSQESFWDLEIQVQRSRRLQRSIYSCFQFEDSRTELSRALFIMCIWCSQQVGQRLVDSWCCPNGQMARSKLLIYTLIIQILD